MFYPLFRQVLTSEEKSFIDQIPVGQELSTLAFCALGYDFKSLAGQLNIVIGAYVTKNSLKSHKLV